MGRDQGGRSSENSSKVTLKNTLFNTVLMTSLSDSSSHLCLPPVHHHHSSHLHGYCFKWRCVFGSFTQREPQKLEICACILSPRSYLRENIQFWGASIVGRSTSDHILHMRDTLKFRMVFICKTKKVKIVHTSPLNSLFSLHVTELSMIYNTFLIHLRPLLQCSNHEFPNSPDQSETTSLFVVNKLMGLFQTLFEYKVFLFQYCLCPTMK